MTDARPAKPTATVFYSWQSDLPNGINRSLIERALKEAIEALKLEGTVALEPVLDRDTQGASGSPNIAATIFDKIDRAAVFVGDVSVIGRAGPKDRPTPNPNVVAELGYALRALGENRIVLVVNTAFGAVEDLPFDLRMRRAVTYELPEAADRRFPLGILRSKLEDALRATLEAAAQAAPAARTPLDAALDAVAAQLPNQGAEVRRYMAWLASEAARLTPDFAGIEPARWDDRLVDAIGASADLVLGFSRLAQRVAEMQAADAAQAIYDGFTGFLDQYTRDPRTGGGPFRPTDFDLAKFLGHELFVTLFAHLIRERRYEIVADLLDRQIVVNNPSGRTTPTVLFTEVDEHVDLLFRREERLKLARTSLHAKLLQDRHTSGPLGEITPMDEFVAADFFLFLRGAASAKDAREIYGWRPWSARYLESEPSFLHNTALRREAERLLRPLGVSDVEALRDLVGNRAPYLVQLFRQSGFWAY